MIKLIATDLDGTMLDDSKRLPENFDTVMHDLNSRNIRFAVSSGRSFCTLKKQFDRYLNDLIFICDNGAYVYDKGEVVSMSVLPDDAVRNMVRFCLKNDLVVLLCGKRGTWHNGEDEATLTEIRKYYLNEKHLDDMLSFDDEIFKVAVFNEDGFSNAQYEALSDCFADRCNVLLSGSHWVDIMNKGVSKGSALSTICNRFGVGYNEVMAFGDYLNDVDMLNCAYYSFAMSNAHSTVKQVANFITGSNNDNSVMKEVKKYCLQ